MHRVKSPVDRWRLLVSGPAGRYKRALPLNNRATFDERLKVLSHRPLPSRGDWCACVRATRRTKNIASCWKTFRLSGGNGGLEMTWGSLRNFENYQETYFVTILQQPVSLSYVQCYSGRVLCVFNGNRDVWVTPFKYPTLHEALLINIRVPLFSIDALP